MLNPTFIHNEHLPYIVTTSVEKKKDVFRILLPSTPSRLQCISYKVNQYKI